MKALKLGLVVSLVALFFIACSTETTNNNANPATNQNRSSAGTVAPPAASSNATANTNSPSIPGAAPATNSNTAAARTASNSNTGSIANIDAAALYTANKCTGCHGADGKGNPNMKDVPNFTDAAWQKKETDAELIKTIKNGHKPMPAYKDKLNDDEIRALVAYVRSFAK